MGVEVGVKRVEVVVLSAMEVGVEGVEVGVEGVLEGGGREEVWRQQDRKSTRLNSSH